MAISYMPGEAITPENIFGVLSLIFWPGACKRMEEHLKELIPSLKSNESSLTLSSRSLK